MPSPRRKHASLRCTPQLELFTHLSPQLSARGLLKLSLTVNKLRGLSVIVRIYFLAAP